MMSMIHFRTRIGLVALALSCGHGLMAADPSQRAASTWPPRGEPQRFAITADTWVSGVGKEREGNNGGASRIKLKGVQEAALIDADLSALRGRRITGALLHLKCASLDQPVLRASVSTVAAPWVEGTGSSYGRQQGAACFASPALGERDWAYPGSTLVDAAWGRGHTRWRFADATPPDADGWQVIAVEPSVVAAAAAGLSHGFAIMDDVGSEWSLKGETFEYRFHPNRFAFSREQNNAGPYLEVWADGADRDPPDAVGQVAVETAGLPAGEARVRWRTPADRGGATLGFDVRYEAGHGEKAMPRYLIPMAASAGTEVSMLVRDLGLTAGQTLRLSIQAVDASGNRGPVSGHDVTVSAMLALTAIPDAGVEPFAPSEELPSVGGLRVAVLDALDKVEARTGRMVPEHAAGYKGGNHLWSAPGRRIRLHTGRNEMTGFLINLEGRSAAARVTLAFPGAKGIRSRLYRLDCVETAAGIMPDVAVPLEGPLALPPAADPQAVAASNTSILAELYVPHAAPAGVEQGTLTIESDGAVLSVAVDLHTWDFTLPDKLSFVPELNAYGTVNPTDKLAYYRMAHEHRTCLNRLYYGWYCRISDNAAPEVNGDRYDWTAFDRDFAPLFDGSAFGDLPRKGEPVDVFYLPINEDWPMPVKPHYRPSYWADEAFDAAYAEGVRRAGAEFSRHVNSRRWNDTIFEFYLNNKVYYKKGKPFDSIPAPWVFDEPAGTQDWWALRWYGILFHQGVASHRGPAKLWYRADISRSEFNRDILRGVLDIEVMGSVTPQKIRMKQDEQRMPAPGVYTEYGSANDPRDSNFQPVIWSLLAWSRGSVGILPWQVIATAEAWNKGEPTSLFYPSPEGPVASVRLKAFARGQQDVEYLTLLADVLSVPLESVAAGLRQRVDLSGSVHKTSEDDAGTIRFEKADAVSLWRMRTAVGAALSARKPPYKRSLRPMPTIVRTLQDLPDLGYVTVAPEVKAAGPQFQR